MGRWGTSSPEFGVLDPNESPEFADANANCLPRFYRVSQF